MSTAVARLAVQNLPGPPGQLLHIGAGTGAELEAYLASRIGKITLVEPDPAAAQALALRAAEAPEGRVRVIAAAVTGPTTEPDQGAVLLRQIFPELSSLRPPTATLQAMFPGLGTPQTVPVRGVPAIGLVRDLGLREGRCHVLVIEAPGESGAILADLAASGLLDGFARVVVQDGVERLYEGQITLDEIEAMLVEAGFGLPLRSGADPDRPHLAMTRDPAQVELRQALAREIERMAQLTQQLAAAEAQLTQQGEELAASREEKRQIEQAHEALARQFAEAEMRLQRQAHALAHSREEMLKAEAQIALIADLLLRDGR